MCIFKQFRRWCFILLALFVVPTTSFAINLNSTSVKGIAQAYGFVLGQEFTLSEIAREFPESSVSVIMARAQFGSTFPNIEKKLETQLRKAMGEKRFQETAANLRTKIQETLKGQQITKETAASFLTQVKDRSKGEIESPILEYLLAVRYNNNLAGEFRDGFRQRYQTDGAGKARGIKLKLQLPLSWAAKEGERPHIVQKWVSENGTGSEIILLDIRDGEDYTPSKEEIEDFIRTGEVKEVIPPDATYVAAGSFTIERQRGYWIQMTQQHERAEMKLYQHILLYQFFFQGKAVGLMCSAGGSETERTSIDEAFKRLRPVCQQALNSLVLMEAY